jgi:hypothetical protein
MKYLDGQEVNIGDKIIAVLMTVSSLALMGLFFLAFISTAYSQDLPEKDNSAESKQLCNPITNELIFCTDKQKLIVTSKDLVTLRFSFTNTSAQEMEVSQYSGGNYTFKVTNEKGDVIPTMLERKMKNGIKSKDVEQEFILSLLRRHRSRRLEPKEIYHERISLGSIYDFTNVGKYYIEITRKTRNPKGEDIIETSLEKIEIEVKEATK